MELEDLKNIWKNRPFEPKQGAEIASMLTGKSKSVIAKIKRNIWLELLLTIIAGLVLLYYTLRVHEGALRWTLIAYLILFTGYIIYYVKKISLLNRFEGSEGNIKTNLERLINDLEVYIRFYRNSYSFLYPIYLILILLFLGLERGLDQLLELLQQRKMILYLVFFVSVFLASSLWLTNWYLRRLYGDHLQKLRNMLNDLAE